MSTLNAPEYDQKGGDSSVYPYNGKLLLSAVILLSIVVFSVFLLHIYARWYLRRRPNTALQSSTHLTDRIDEVEFFSKGIDSKAVASLPKFAYKREGGESVSVDCTVCLSSIEEGQMVRVLSKCEHVFHVECVDKWWLLHSTCPLCRGRVQQEVAIEVVAKP